MLFTKIANMLRKTTLCIFPQAYLYKKVVPVVEISLLQNDCFHFFSKSTPSLFAWVDQNKQNATW